ncbi:MAG: hypothetical protein EXS35_00375 [Pedosphaera sp.]|nr:hypothetical protein [Pedosphaera sp.]
MLTGIFCAALLLAWGLNWFALIPWRRSLDDHWTERARRLYPAHVSARLNIWLIPATLVLGQKLILPEVQAAWFLTALCAWMGTLLGSFPFDREVIPELASFRVWLGLVIASWLLQFSVWILFVAGFIVMPERFSGQTMWIGCGLLIFHTWINLGLFLRLARLFRLLGPPPALLKLIVAQVSQRMGKPCRVWLLDSPVSYAAALPLTGDLIFSRRIVEVHPEAEIAAICAHEIGHLTEPRMTRVGRWVGSLKFFPWLFVKPVVNEFAFGGLATLAVSSALLTVFSLRLARRMEERADAVACDNQAAEGIYARALERLYETNQLPTVMPGNRKVHPHLFDRMVAAGVTPAYDRPKPPEHVAWTTFPLCVVIGIEIGIVLSHAEGTELKRLFHPDPSSSTSVQSPDWKLLSTHSFTNNPYTNSTSSESQR